MENVIKINPGNKLEKYIDKIATQRHDAIHKLIMQPSAENACKVRELNGQLWGMLAVLNCIEDQVKAPGKKVLNNCRDIIKKAL